MTSLQSHTRQTQAWHKHARVCADRTRAHAQEHTSFVFFTMVDIYTEIIFSVSNLSLSFQTFAVIEKNPYIHF